MSQAAEFVKIVNNGCRKPMQRAKLEPFLKRKHPAVAPSLRLVASTKWGTPSTS